MKSIIFIIIFFLVVGISFSQNKLTNSNSANQESISSSIKITCKFKGRDVGGCKVNLIHLKDTLVFFTSSENGILIQNLNCGIYNLTISWKEFKCEFDVSLSCGKTTIITTSFCTKNEVNRYLRKTRKRKFAFSECCNLNQ
jgi:hypothetical protein